MNIFFLILCLLLTACSTLPPAISDAPAFDLSYSQAMAAVKQYKNAPVRWGGVIIEVENEQNHSIMQVLSYPLSSYGEPLLAQASLGRFLVETRTFIDPAAYTKDSEVTVSGTFNGTAERVIGKRVVQLPVITAQLIYQWPKYPYNTFYDYGYGYGAYGYPFYSYGYSPFFWGGGYPRPFRFPY